MAISAQRRVAAALAERQQVQGLRYHLSVLRMRSRNPCSVGGKPPPFTPVAFLVLELPYVPNDSYSLFSTNTPSAPSGKAFVLI